MMPSEKVVEETFSVPEYLVLGGAAQNEASETQNPGRTLSCEMNPNFVNISLSFNRVEQSINNDCKFALILFFFFKIYLIILKRGEGAKGERASPADCTN